MICDLPSRDLSREKQVGQIKDIIDEVNVSGEYAVYTLRCDKPDSDEEIIRRLDQYYSLTDEEAYGPEWTRRILYADELYYVGQTKNSQRRLLEHVRGVSDAALFTTEFPPIELVDIEWAETREEATERERERRREIDDRELTNNLSRDPISSDGFDKRLGGLMEMSAEWYIEDYDPPKKKHVFEEWKSEFLESFEAWGGDIIPAYEKWKEANPIDSPENPEEPLPTKSELNDYWDSLVERQSEYVDEVNAVYHKLQLESSPETVRVAYSF